MESILKNFNGDVATLKKNLVGKYSVLVDRQHKVDISVTKQSYT